MGFAVNSDAQNTRASGIPLNERILHRITNTRARITNLEQRGDVVACLPLHGRGAIDIGSRPAEAAREHRDADLAAPHGVM